MFLYCDWLGWLRIIILAIFRLKRSAILFSFLWSGPGVKSRTLTWNTEGSFTSSAFSKTNLSGYWEITQTQKAYKFWSTVIGHQLFPVPPLPAPGKLWGTHFNYCVNIHLYMKQCTKCSLCSQSIRSLNSKHRINTNQLSKATIPLCFGFYRSHVDVLQS